MTAKVNKSQVTKTQRDRGVTLNKGSSRRVCGELLMYGGIMPNETTVCPKTNATNVTPTIRRKSLKTLQIPNITMKYNTYKHIFTTMC